MSHGLPWTRTELDLLKKMLSEGYAVKKIASVLGRSTPSVYSQAREQNVKVARPAIWDTRSSELFELREEGLSFEDIGSRMGLSENSVRCAYYRLRPRRKSMRRNAGVLTLRNILENHLSPEIVATVLSELRSAGVEITQVSVQHDKQ